HTMNVNWRMKNFIDRYSYLMHRPRFFNQRFMVLITSGSYRGVKEAMKALVLMGSGGKVIHFYIIFMFLLFITKSKRLIEYFLIKKYYQSYPITYAKYE
ncbi:unnamed protein product, partial [marine sediment metagenome]